MTCSIKREYKHFLRYYNEGSVQVHLGISAARFGSNSTMSFDQYCRRTFTKCKLASDG